MKRATIEKAAICYWSEDDDCYVVESPLFPRTAGIGETEQEAMAHFREMLDDIYPELKAGNVDGYDKNGCPANGGIVFGTQIQRRSKNRIAQLAKSLGCSEGEVIDYLVSYEELGLLPSKPRVTRRANAPRPVVAERKGKYTSTGKTKFSRRRNP